MRNLQHRILCYLRMYFIWIEIEMKKEKKKTGNNELKSSLV